MRRRPERDRRTEASLAGATPSCSAAAARHRALLRMRVEICAALRDKGLSSAVGAALAVALRLGEEAATELAGIPDTPELRRRDAALLDGGDAMAPPGFETQMRELVGAYRNGRALDLFTASPSEVLACCIARSWPDWACANESSWPG